MAQSIPLVLDFLGLNPKSLVSSGMRTGKLCKYSMPPFLTVKMEVILLPSPMSIGKTRRVNMFYTLRVMPGTW